jgi:hypothetical protein
MKAAILLVLTLAGIMCGLRVQAQSSAPGYLGRRVMVEYSLASWAPIYIEGAGLGGLTNYKGTKYGWPDDRFYLQNRHNLGMSVCVSRRSVLGLRLSSQRMGYLSGYYSFADNYVDTLGRISAPGLQLFWQSFYFFRRGNIAPLGPYSELGYRLALPALRPAAVGNGNGPVVSRKLYSALTLVSGYTAALSGRVLLNFGVEVQVSFLNKPLHPLTASRRDQGNEGVIFSAMSRSPGFGFRIALQGLLF